VRDTFATPRAGRSGKLFMCGTWGWVLRGIMRGGCVVVSGKAFFVLCAVQGSVIVVLRAGGSSTT
jgi:hypothetical protein